MGWGPGQDREQVHAGEEKQGPEGDEKQGPEGDGGQATDMARKQEPGRI